MTPRDQLHDRLVRSTDRQIGAATLLLLLAVGVMDMLLIAGAAWICWAIVMRTKEAMLLLGLALSGLVITAAVLATWRVSHGYRNLRRIIDDARNGRTES